MTPDLLTIPASDDLDYVPLTDLRAGDSIVVAGDETGGAAVRLNTASLYLLRALGVTRIERKLIRFHESSGIPEQGGKERM